MHAIDAIGSYDFESAVAIRFASASAIARDLTAARSDSSAVLLAAVNDSSS